MRLPRVLLRKTGLGFMNVESEGFSLYLYHKRVLLRRSATQPAHSAGTARFLSELRQDPT